MTKRMLVASVLSLGFSQTAMAGYVGAIPLGIGEVPEPGTLVIWSLLGAIGLGVTWWRRRRA